MLMVRLQRVGRKNDPSFRVVVVDSKEAAQSGKAIEVVGSHDARNDRTELKVERIKYWLSVGAQASQTVHNLLVKKGALDGAKSVDVSSKKLGKKATAVIAAKKAAEEKAVKEAEAKKAAEEKAKEESEATAKAEAEKPAEEVVAAEPVAEEAKVEEAPVVEVAPEEAPASA